jgi:hypothetical protein
VKCIFLITISHRDFLTEPFLGRQDISAVNQEYYSLLFSKYLDNTYKLPFPK